VLLLADYLTGPGWEWEPAARDRLTANSWPGNIRQLANAIERAKLLADDEVIRIQNLPPEIAGERDIHSRPADFEEADLASLNRSHVVHTMKRESGNKLRAAQTLGISRRSLYRLLEKFNVTEDEYKE
jgi:transcriptional regulator of acetoin/glycerol metabolism